MFGMNRPVTPPSGFRQQLSFSNSKTQQETVGEKRTPTPISREDSAFGEFKHTPRETLQASVSEELPLLTKKQKRVRFNMLESSDEKDVSKSSRKRLRDPSEEDEAEILETRRKRPCVSYNEHDL